MKSFILILLFIPLFFIACTKQNEPPVDNPNDTTNNPPPAPTDTLAAGWTKLNLPGSNVLTDIFFTNNQLGYAVDDDDLYKSTDGGSTWTVFENEQGALFDNIAPAPNGNVFISLGHSNMIFKSINGGAVVGQKIESIDGDADIYFTGNDTGYITRGYTGSEAGLWKTVDGGNTWNFIPLPGYSAHLQSYLSFYQDAGYCTSSGIYHINKSTGSWAKSKVTGIDSFTSINSVNTMVAYAAAYSGNIYKTTDGGFNFNKVGTLPTHIAFTDIAFVNEQTGYATNLNRIYKTVDGGKTWTIEAGVVHNQLIEVHFTDAKHGWACGSSGIILIYRG